ncbi:hypothetical protein [Glutamicibacter arilaitensis]|uniref:hypothetical protein n=1 Tax=Glutamicibacter arilaitensis TaxID=256701 RepID=UPI003F92F1EF
MVNIFQAEVNDSTLDDVVPESANRWRRLLSLITLAVVAALVIAAGFGIFEQERSASVGNGQLQMDIDFPSTVRAGNEMDLAISITSAQPLPETVEISISQEYLDFFEDFAVLPEAQSQSSGRQGAVAFEVSAQPGARHAVFHFKGRAADDWAPRTDGQVAVEVGGSTLSADIRTWRMP